MIQWIKSAAAIRMPPAITPRRPDAAIKATVAAARTTESAVRLSRLPLAVCTTASEPPTRIAYSGNDHRGSSRTSTAKAPAAPPMAIAAIAGNTNRSIPGEGPFAVWMSEASTGKPGRSAFGFRNGTGIDDNASSPKACTRLARHR